MLARTPRPDLSASSVEPCARRNVFRKSLICVAIRRRVLVRLLYEDDPAESVFQPTVLYLSTKRELHVAGVAIAAAVKPLQILEVGKINSVALTERPFVFNPVFNPFIDAYTLAIICSAASSR